MKIRVNVTVELTDEQVEILAKLAEQSGHSHGEVKAPGKLIRRYLESKVTNAVDYCHEHLQKD